jgi:hypothetical protein
MLLGLPDFSRLLTRLRCHDENALADLMRCYEPDVCRMLEARLRHCPLGRIVDPSDIWQAVLLRFYQRASDGRFDLPDSEHLLHLLQTMASNELRDQSRWLHRGRRDVDRQQAGERALAGISDAHATPAQVAEDHDLFEYALHHLRGKERNLVVGWSEGKDWDELAAQCKGTPEAARKCVTRAVTRLARQLGGRTPVLDC